MPVENIHPDASVQALIMPYGASQPSIVRTALAALENVEDCAFIDLGSGKGRVTAVATEFGFREVIGVEISPELARIARANAEVMARRFPRRPRIQIFEMNVLDFSFPPGSLAIFLYNPFKFEIVSALVRRLEAMLGSRLARLFVIYYNPVHCECFDASAAIERCFDQSLPYDPAEIGFGPDTVDRVVIWRSAR